jgi:hypothetical protein
VSSTLLVRMILIAAMLGSLMVVAAQPGLALQPPMCSSRGGMGIGLGYPLGHQLSEVYVPAVLSRAQPEPLYTRFCGPVTIAARLHGALFRIRGGRCVRAATGGYRVQAGLSAQAAARGQWLGLFVHDPRAKNNGTFTLGAIETKTLATWVGALGQLGGNELEISGGTITIGQSGRDGTFALRLRDATRVTGNWTCG